jgi:hypothetical protein
VTKNDEVRLPNPIDEPEYGVPKEQIPEDWIEAREIMHRHPWAVFHVRKWYFPVLVALALVLFSGGILFPSFEMTIAAAILSITLYQWNKRARIENEKRV